MSLLIAVCSIAATAWLAVQTTTSAIQQEQGQALSDDAKIYDALVGYAATHSDWSGVRPTLRSLASDTGREIVLTTKARRLVATSTAGDPQLPQRTSAEVDALNVDQGLLPAAHDGIDPRVRGPYRLTPAARVEQWKTAAEFLACTGAGSDGAIITSASQDVAGYVTTRPVDVFDFQGDKDLSAAVGKCPVVLAKPTAREIAALSDLERAVSKCLRSQGREPVELTTSLIGSDGQVIAEPPTSSLPGGLGARPCVLTSERDQLRSYVAPAVQLFVRNPGGGPQARFDLSTGNLARIFAVAVAVLAATAIATVLLGSRLVRPLRALTRSVQHPGEHDGRVPVGRPDEIGVLATALNTLAERRDRADHQRAALVRDVAHELRTPLTNIRSWLEAIQDGLATPASDPALTEALLNEALQLQGIIDDLQDLAVADSTDLRYAPELGSVGELLDQVLTAHRPNADARHIELVSSTPDGLEVYADPVRLRQALGNLVTNAIRYSPVGGTVRLEAREDPEHVLISVVDDGAGIAPDDLARVFDRFWRADQSRSRESGGSGLGLAIVKQIAEAHQGSVTATSTLGRGSTFTLRLPKHPTTH